MFKAILRKIILYPPIAKSAVRGALILHNKSYHLCGRISSVLEPDGLHPKHRLMNYHKFFIDNVHTGDCVLDVGCGNGALLRDVAMQAGTFVTGVDILEEHVKSARKRLSGLKNVEIIHADIWNYKDKEHFDTIILSNTLEHLDKRSDLLKHLQKNFTPGQILIRVPMFEREWLVPYKKESGVEWRLDSTHMIEYTEAEFHKELAGLNIRKIMFRWGEIYAVAVPYIPHEV